MIGDSAVARAPYQSFDKVLPAILFITSIFLLNFTSRIIFAPLLPFIEQDLHLSHTGSGSFFLIISIGYCLSILASGFFSSSLSHKGAIVLSSVVTGSILCLLPFCESLSMFRLTLFCLGLGAGLYLPSGLATITTIVPSAYWGRAIAVHELAPNLGSVAAPLAVALLTGWISWLECLWLLGGLLIVLGSIYWLRGSTSGGYGVRPDYKRCKDILATGGFWLMVLFFSTAISSSLGLYTMLPLYLVAEKGFEYNDANHLVAFSRATGIIMPFVGGWLGDRFGNRQVIAFVLLGTGTLIIPLGFFSGTPLFIFVVLQAMLAACFFPSGLAELSVIGASHGGNVVVSLCIPLAFVFGGGMIPVLIGFIGDHFSLGMGFICAGMLSIGVGGLAVFWWYHDRFPGSGKLPLWLVRSEREMKAMVNDRIFEQR